MFRNAIRTVLESGTALVSKCQAANHFPTSISRGFEVLKFRRRETGDRSADGCFSGDGRQETGVQTDVFQETGDGRQELRRMFFRRRETGEGSADKCRSGGWRKGKGWQCETDLREEWLKRTVERVDLGPYG